MPWPPGDRSVHSLFIGSFFRAFGAPRVDFSCFLVGPEPHRKIKFFRFLQKSTKTKNKSTLGAPGLHFGSFSWLWGTLFASIFHCFLNVLKWENVWFFNIFSGLEHQKPFIFGSFFHRFYVISKSLPGTVCRGSKRRPIMKSWFLEPFSIFIENAPNFKNNKDVLFGFFTLRFLSAPLSLACPRNFLN